MSESVSLLDQALGRTIGHCQDCTQSFGGDPMPDPAVLRAMGFAGGAATGGLAGLPLGLIAGAVRAGWKGALVGGVIGIPLGAVAGLGLAWLTSPPKNAAGDAKMQAAWDALPADEQHSIGKFVSDLKSSMKASPT